MKYYGFNEDVFRRNVDTALQSVDRILEVHRNPRMAEDVDHEYANKYDLANLMTNVAIIAQMNCLERFGLTAEALQSLDKNKATTLRFQAYETCTFLKEQEVKVPMGRTVETVEDTQTNSSSFFGNTTKATVSRVVNRVKEYHWKVDISWEISIYQGTDVAGKTTLQDRKSSTVVVIQSSKDPPFPARRNLPTRDLSLTWFLHQIDVADLVAQFKIDVSNPETKTPLRNKQVEKALDFMEKLSDWAAFVRGYYCNVVHSGIIKRHNPAAGPPPPNPYGDLASWTDDGIFIPVQPLMEERTNGSESPALEGGEAAVPNSVLKLADKNDEKTSPVFSVSDTAKFINEHLRSIEEKMSSIQKVFPPKHLVKPISVAEASLIVIGAHIAQLKQSFSDSVVYIEWMLEQQLVAAIGKRVDSADLDKFVRYHNAKLLEPVPKPFCHAIRRPNHYPDGVLSIEGSYPGEKKEAIDTFTREVSMEALKVPLNAAATLELTGKAYLHGWLQHRFANSSKRYELIARARQFSSFMLVVGTMTGSDELDPKDAIILQNKDEVIIPLLLNELPSAKEFKDAIQSLSPEQQRFAKSFRSMQLESSVLGVCIIQIKPQLENLLGLPPDALTKEMKLTQDLMQLFIEYQVPSDLLSYDGEEASASVREKVDNVKGHVKAVMDVVDGEKEKQLQESSKKAEMAYYSAVEDLDSTAYEFSSKKGGARVKQKSRSRFGPQPSMAMMSAAPMMAMSAPPPPAPMTVSVMAKAAPAPDAMVAEAPTRRVQPQPSPAAPSPKPPQDISGTTPRDSTGHPDDASAGKAGGGKVDFTAMPKILDALVEKHVAGEDALRSTVVKTGNTWVRNRQENLLVKSHKQSLSDSEIKSEKNKAFDLLDALSRSGSLAIDCAELHVIICLTHRFDKDVMGTIIQDNINPIEKLEMSTLLFASAIHGVSPRNLVRDEKEQGRLAASFPLLLEG